MAFTELVTTSDVLEIIETDVTDATPFIQAAAGAMSSLPSITSLSDDLKKEIQRWLSAHFLAMYDQRVSSEKTGDASFNYEGTTGMGLDSTRYGQQAKILDPTGSLAGLSKQQALFEVL
jgi:hypothetical protein